MIFKKTFESLKNKLMKSKKGIKTTTVAIIALAIYATITTLYLLDLIGAEKFSLILGSITAITGVVIGIIAKDADKSHTQDDDFKQRYEP